ncbi:F-box/WD repeat-containing protein 7 [Drosophila grimshawi]|uniref:F-box/WD repeat-containing protein 7 n=2 Tax=Drosophila grimshawi TaxID=7222 RepID=B4J1G9_DROGR|nr:F-box/WD repeat-containing protein 7 [Drosophila grimshawi]XP_032599015.1 F-box/WD repeat-containing protein 7 [Drosophila grimshawi]EDV95860.1 anon-2 [Drosophila grimshawi]
MDKGCAIVSINCESAEEFSSTSSTASTGSETKPQTPQSQPQHQLAIQTQSQPKPSTSQVGSSGAGGTVPSLRVKQLGSMSKLREDVEDCVTSNSQHGFAVVLDDDDDDDDDVSSSNDETGVLETYEISSSNSLPASTGAAASSSDVGDDVVVPVDDSSSSDTLNGRGRGRARSAASEDHVFYNDDDNDIVDDEPPVVCLINDDDDFDEEEEIVDEDDDDVDDVDGGQSMPLDCPNTSQLNGGGGDGIIMTADGSKIFLETPVVEEPLSHTHVTVGNATQSELLTGKPKRLSDEFEAEASAEAQQQTGGNRVLVKSEPIAQGTAADVASSSLHDRQMSVRLKQMSITPNASASAGSGSGSTSNSSSSSNSANSQSLSKADILSMDRIERRDFEREQRLTGGIIIGTSSLMNKNRLNLSLINRAAAAVGAGVVTVNSANGNGSGSSDDWPSSSQGRAFSSDSKCTYKDLSTTPTSSRKYTNSRLSKSTAKLNLGSSLASAAAAAPAASAPPPPVGNVRDQSSQSNSSSNSSTTYTINSKLPIVLIMKPTTTTNSAANSSSSNNASTSTTHNNRSDVYTNTINSNENHQHQMDKDVAPAAAPLAATSFSSVGSQTSQESGCSRTSAAACAASSAASTGSVGDVDAQPSTSATSTTSSARCHYAAPTSRAATRQVNASAQTQERFLARSGLAAAAVGGGVVGGVSVSTVRTRSRRGGEAATRRGSNDPVILEVVVEENSNNNGDSAGNGGGGGGIVEPGDFSAEEPWGNCDEENNCSDLEEICTCQNSILTSSRSGSSGSLSDSDCLDNYHMFAAEDESISFQKIDTGSHQQQRKRKYNESRYLDGDYSMTGGGGGGGDGGGRHAGAGDNSRKRIAYDFASTPRSTNSSTTVLHAMTPTTAATVGAILGSCSPAVGRRTPRALIPTRDNPPPELPQWLAQFQRWSHAERLVAVDRLIDHCDPSQVRHMMKVIEPQFQRDFISLLPRELALFVLSYLEPKDLLRAAQTCRSWRFLCDDNLLWKEKCRKAMILTESRSDRPKRGRDGNMPPIASPWKAAYMRQHIIEMNWRSRPVRKPKVLKGHDDHVITCLQFSGNRIVSGSDDNTLKVWSAVNGKCLRTLVGHTGGVWSSQMSGNIIISGSTDRTLKVWDMDSGTCVHTLQGHTSTVRCMHLHGNKVVSGSRDATLRVWDIEIGSCLHVLVGHLAAVRCVQYDGKLIVSGAYDYMVKIWHPERQECLHTLQGHTNRVYSLQFDGLHVVSGSLDTSIRVWDVETGNCKHTLMGHQSLTSGMELRQNILVSGNADSTVKVWDITTGQCLQTLSGPNKHQSAVTCLQFNSRFVVTSSDDGTVKLWDVKTGDFIRNLVALDSGGSGGVVWRIRANDTKLICAVGSRNGTEETKLMVLDFDVEGACVKCS